MNVIPVEVGGQIMAFVPGPERFPARFACRAMALWPTDSVADVWLGPNEADRLRHPRRRRPRAAPIDGDGDGWWRSRVAVVRICSVPPFCAASRKRLRNGGPVAVERFGPTLTGTVLPDDATAEGGWAWLRRLFPAARAVEAVGADVAGVYGHWLEAPPSAALVRSEADDPFDPSTPMPSAVYRTVSVDANAPAETAASLRAALGKLCRGAYPREGGWLGLRTDGARSFAEVVDAVVAHGFVPSASPSTAAADADTVWVSVEYPSAQADRIRLARRPRSRFVLYPSRGTVEEVEVPPPEDAAAAGDTMAATWLDIGRATSESVAAVRGLRWPRLRELRVHGPWPDLDGVRTAGPLCAALEWALALPRLSCLAILSMVDSCDAVDALLSGLAHRAARGMPPLRLELERQGRVACVTRLVAHPAVAMVGLRVGLSLRSRAAKRELQGLCAALAAPAGPAVLRQFWVLGTALPNAVLRPVVRAQPLLRDLQIWS